MQDIVYWIWLSLSCTPGTATFPRLIEKFKDARSVYEADLRDISRCIDHRSSDRANFVEKSLDKAEEIFAYCQKMKIGILSYPDENYPKNLKKIVSPPIVLYYRGILPDFNKGFYASIVGTRAISDYGRTNAFKISYDLACAGATIVSGMAMGIDGIAHAAALEAGKPTVAVIGSGIDVCYPMQHLKLAREIVKTGCVITEFPPHTSPSKTNFPIRNRIISGLSSTTIVIEGREKSGARITASYALEQKRKLYALPGNVGSPNSEATAILLKNGAQAIVSADDVVRDFQDEFPGILNPFNLKLKLPVNIMDTLAKYSVVSNAPGDPIFRHTVNKKAKSQTKDYYKNDYKNEDKTSSKPVIVDNNDEVDPCIDKLAFEIYKKIPLSGSCAIETLVDAKSNLRDVMKCLLKLEMAHFVKIEPGERVSRKFKLERQ